VESAAERVEQKRAEVRRSAQRGRERAGAQIAQRARRPQRARRARKGAQERARARSKARKARKSARKAAGELLARRGSDIEAEPWARLLL
jgi:hypothetical protein